MVPPPTINDNPSNALADGQEDDGQYREDPSIYEDPKYNSKGRAHRPSANFQFHQTAQPAPQPRAEYQQTQYNQPQYQQQYQPSQFRSSPLFSQQTSFSQPQQNVFSQGTQQFDQYRPQSQIYHQQPQFSYQAYTPQYNQNQNQYNPYQNFNPFSGHPAQNFDPNTGSYTINFTGK